jgi:signal transduction histidine kinase
LMKVTKRDGDTVFISQRFVTPPVERERHIRINHQVYSVLVGIAALIAFAIALFLLLRSVSRPVESLQAWAKGLDEAQLDKPIPNFRYKELNALAAIIHNSLQSVKHTLEREREFVNHASHELRTPIAVVRSSIELLCRVVDVENSKGRNAVSRIDNAAKTMADLTETLLWLGREDGNELAVRDVDVADLVRTLVDDLMYLLQGKSVSVTLNLDQHIKPMPETAAQIVIGNIIRNAFQHTYHGKVDISLTADKLIVSNFENNPASSPYLSSGGAEMGEGFGIGLKLIDKLTRKMNWVYLPEHSKKGYTVVLVMSAPTHLQS